ncbi:MAG: site-2 protease family protein [Deltaproteobacteria bacterium]|nr:site-2 protease family protein [Deltaproteobacteria bacterium]
MKGESEKTFEMKAMRGGIALFKVAGIQISFDYSWLIIFALVLLSMSLGYFPRYYPGHTLLTYWMAGTIATALFFASVVTHELAHSLVAIRSGIQISEITLFIFGGVSKITEEPQDPVTELKVAIVGPLSSFALAAIFWVIKDFFAGFELSLITGIFSYLTWINLALGIFNLIPGFPLDGGRVFRAVYWWKTGSLTYATRLAADLGRGFALALMLWGGVQIFFGDLIGGLWFIFIGMFLRSLSQRGYEEVVMRKSLEGVQVKELMTREVVSVSPDIPIAQLVHDYFLHYAFGGFPVKDDGRVVGVVSIAGVRQVPRQEQDSRKVAEVMEPVSEQLVISEDISLAEALRRMTQAEQDRLLVMQQDRMIGLITRNSLQRFIQIKQILEPEESEH